MASRPNASELDPLRRRSFGFILKARPYALQAVLVVVEDHCSLTEGITSLIKSSKGS